MTLLLAILELKGRIKLAVAKSHLGLLQKYMGELFVEIVNFHLLTVNYFC